jgi:acyl dehydratase
VLRYVHARGPGGVRVISAWDVAVGSSLPERVFAVTRADLVRYAGASGDFNPIHWNQRVATGVGLPDVIAHGMFTMALAGRVVTDWTGDPGALVEYQVRFSRPVVVPDDDSGAEVTVRGAVGAPWRARSSAWAEAQARGRSLGRDAVPYTF